MFDLSPDIVPRINIDDFVAILFNDFRALKMFAG
jgi:hypothetical protein